jgi:pimeloyl-ACP methyl ester carboxylesterase
METNNEKPKMSYETLWKFIIRPPRDIYTEDLMGHPLFMFKGKTYLRKDYDLISSEGFIMKCSFFEPEDSFRPKKIMPVVLYLHGNSSSRLEGIRMLKELLKRDINFFVVDFPGCGLSEGEYISLGYHESHDVKILVDFIEKIPGVGYIGLWGRSMGAATTMIYAHKDERIKAICMDSPFADFSLLAKELVLKQIKLPVLLIEGALKIIKMTVRKKNGLDIDKLKPIESAPETTQPAIFIHANSDELINNKHSEMLFDAYKGNDKCLKRCEGQHNTRRPNKIIRDIGEFFYKHLVNGDNENYNKESNEQMNKKSNMFDFINENEKSTNINENNNKINKEINNMNKENEINKNEIKEKNSKDNIENCFENEEHLAKKEEKNKNEMESLTNELSKCFEEQEHKLRNIDINNEIDENTN